MKTTYVFYLLLILSVGSIISCTKEEVVGSISGTILLYNNDEEQIFDFNDVKVIGYNSNNDSIIAYPDSEGKFRIDFLLSGERRISFTKPEFISVELTSFLNTTDIDDIAGIPLIEKVPFSYQNMSFTFNDERNTVTRSTEDYLPAGNYMVTEIYCFGKDRNVSINNCFGLKQAGGSSSVSIVNSTHSESWGGSGISYYTDMGFELNDTVFVVNYPVNRKIDILRDFRDIYQPDIVLGMDNISVVSYFILK